MMTALGGTIGGNRYPHKIHELWKRPVYDTRKERDELVILTLSQINKQINPVCCGSYKTKPPAQSRETPYQRPLRNVYTGEKERTGTANDIIPQNLLQYANQEPAIMSSSYHSNLPLYY